jgi:hypothetical protein
MLARLLAWGFPSEVVYTGVDAQPANIAEARERYDDEPVQANWVTADVFDFIRTHQRSGSPAYDILIAHAFLDLMDLPTSLPRLFTLLVPGGLAYFTLNFDGVTTFEPTIDPALDALIERLYHQSMNERATGGESQTGRRLFHQMKAAGADVLAAGSSDWVVVPGGDGSYPGDEAYFLRHILHFFAESLSGHPQLEGVAFEGWLHTRHQHIEAGELVYIAHQLDYLGRFAGA